ncbi:MAG: flippase-like domain-containing protein [Ardenticatenaceae bacterium]|nr:flippase-like domain-containing protein [Ardenticatenaceae bacterium]MCB9003286.1 flippase-like domain-containing protein [Ardenticatenaceae bacterium]
MDELDLQGGKGDESAPLPPRPPAPMLASGKVRRRWLRRINFLLGLGLMIGGLWYVTRQITLAEIGRALRQANGWYVALGTAVILLTLAVKTIRWRLLFHPPEQRPPAPAAFWAMMLGQFVNTAVPFLRIGELARVYALSRATGLSKMRALGTLLVEKTLDLVMLIFTLLILLPFVVLPDFMTERGFLLGGVATAVLVLLYLLAYQTELIIKLLRVISRRLPDFLGHRLLSWGVSGLEGLTALRSHRANLTLLAASAAIALLATLTPWAIFPAFGLPYGLKEAALINVILLVAGSIPLPTPAGLGIVEFAVMFMLRQFGLMDEALAFSYAITFHLVVDLPKLIFGALALTRTDWRANKE